MSEQIGEIKAKIDLSDLISLDCKLEDSRGAHENKHGSESGNCLTVYDENGEQKWKCHHCKVGGDCFDWIADRDGLDPEKDFPQILEIAAEYAGTELDTSGERRRVFECLTAAAEHFNSNLTNEMYADIEAHWGITRETVDKLQIGMSKLDNSLEEYLQKQGFTFDDCQKSGLFSGVTSLHPFFKGRYIFPYWIKGQVRYMIARATDKTPDSKYEKTKKGDFIKFKKLRTQTKKAEYISKHVRNDVMFGADSLWEIGGDFCIITEGIADAVMAIQSGFPCISPVTTRFRKQDQKPILQLVRKFAKVYICMDNEDNEAGLAGAYSTCKFLIDNGVDASIVELPRAVGVDKIDLADYLRDNDMESFKNLLPLAYKPPEFFTPPADQFLIMNDSGKLKFSPRLFAEWLVNESNYNFKSFFDDHEILFYTDGVYRVNGKTMIGQIMEEVVIDYTNNHSVTEVVGHVERMTYIERDEFDADPYVINLKNCLYNLRTGETLSHTPDHLSLNQLPVLYNPDTKDNQWERFLEEILPDERDRHTIREMFGHTLIRTYEHQYWFALTGGGANGKGVTLTVLKNLIGSKNVSSVELQDFENAFASSQMYGKMANIGGDLPARALSSTGMLKKLTGGDPIHAQFKNKPIFEFINYATVIYAANQIPRSPDFTDAFRRRIILVKFEKTIDVSDRIAYLGEKMSADPDCLSSVLNFAIKGARDMIKAGDIYHKYNEDEMAQIYIELSDSIATFLIECIEFTFDDNDVIVGKELYRVYKKWWVNKNKNGMVAPLKSSNVFSTVLGNHTDIGETHRAVAEDGKEKRGWKWIQVKEEFLIFDAQQDLGTPGTPGTGVSRLSENNENLHFSMLKNDSFRECEDPRPERPTCPELESLLGYIKTGIFMLGYSGQKEFTSSDLLIKYFKGHPAKIKGLTTELLTELLDANLDELKIIKLDDKTYKQKEK